MPWRWWWRQREDVLFARGPLVDLLAEHEGVLLVDAGGIVLIVGSDPVRVEADLLAGVVRCPGCGGSVGPWSFARQRVLRGEEGPVVVRPRRGRCRSCATTHVLLPDVAVLRRVDTVGGDRPGAGGGSVGGGASTDR